MPWCFAGLVVNRMYAENIVGVAARDTDFPTPGVDDADWFVYETSVLGPRPTSAADSGFQVIDLDSKAMRKIHESDKEVIFLFGLLNTIGVDVAVDLAVILRMLVKT